MLKRVLKPDLVDPQLLHSWVERTFCLKLRECLLLTILKIFLTFVIWVKQKFYPFRVQLSCAFNKFSNYLLRRNEIHNLWVVHRKMFVNPPTLILIVWDFNKRLSINRQARVFAHWEPFFSAPLPMCVNCFFIMLDVFAKHGIK